MALIQFAECGRSISDTAPQCIGCGAPMTVCLGTTRVVQLNNSPDNAPRHGSADDPTLPPDSAPVDEATTTGWQGLSPSDRQRRREQFQSAVKSMIRGRFAEVMTLKTDKVFGYPDALTLTADLRGLFSRALGTMPAQVDAACQLSEVLLSPSREERKAHIKAALGLVSGSAGLAMVLAGVAGALGWGAGAVAALSIWVAGTTLAGPIAWGTAGLAALSFAGYIVFTKQAAVSAERFLNTLEATTATAIKAIWEEHGAVLSAHLESISSGSNARAS